MHQRRPQPASPAWERRRGRWDARSGSNSCRRRWLSCPTSPLFVASERTQAADPPAVSRTWPCKIRPASWMPGCEEATHAARQAAATMKMDRICREAESRGSLCQTCLWRAGQSRPNTFILLKEKIILLRARAYVRFNAALFFCVRVHYRCLVKRYFGTRVRTSVCFFSQSK
jgi:hypothetical protein